MTTPPSRGYWPSTGVDNIDNFNNIIINNIINNIINIINIIGDHVAGINQYSPSDSDHALTQPFFGA